MQFVLGSKSSAFTFLFVSLTQVIEFLILFSTINKEMSVKEVYWRILNYVDFNGNRKLPPIKLHPLKFNNSALFNLFVVEYESNVKI